MAKSSLPPTGSTERPPSPGGLFFVSEETLRQAIAERIPEARLSWRPVVGRLRGLFLEEEAALRPLPPDRVPALMDDPPFWALLWPSGQLLCQRLWADPELVRGRRVVDLGCGSGLVACAAAASGALEVWAVDRDPWALTVAELTAAANHVTVRLASEVPSQSVDTLILADFLYDRAHLEELEGWESVASEVVVVDSRLRQLERSGYHWLGRCEGRAVPDLDPHREFADLSLWYRGPRLDRWRQSLLESRF